MVSKNLARETLMEKVWKIHVDWKKPSRRHGESEKRRKAMSQRKDEQTHMSFMLGIPRI